MTILAGALAGSAMAQAPGSGCALPSEPKDIPAALDGAISGSADKDRACMKALLIPEARMMFVSLGADGAPSYRLETLDDWIARIKARGHAMLEEKQLKFHIERYGDVAHSGAASRCTATANKSRAASTAFKRSRKPAAGELPASSCRPSRPLRGFPRNICRNGGKPKSSLLSFGCKKIERSAAVRRPFSARYLALLRAAPGRYEMLSPLRRGLRLRGTPNGVTTFCFCYQRRGRPVRLMIGHCRGH